MGIVIYLVDLLCLLNLGLQQLLYRILDNLSSFLHSACESGQWLFEFGFHLSSNALVLFTHSLYLSTDCIQRGLEGSGLVRTKRLSTQIE